MIINPPQRQPSTSVDDLVAQLKLIQDVARRGFWLTADELANMLELDLQLLVPTDSDPPGEFEWRNFICHRIGDRGGVVYWKITERNQSADVGQANGADSKPEPAAPQVPAVAAVPTPEPIHPARFIQIEDFWAQAEVDDLLDLVFKSQPNFQSTNVTTNDLDYRRSYMLNKHEFPAFADLIVKRIQENISDILENLGLAPFPVDDIEAQLTSHNDGHYYKVHNDNGSPDTATRELTYVYYFHRQPKGFSGGQLKIFDSVIRNNQYQAAESFHLVEPLHNSIVFFPSYHLHEVLPIQCPSRQFEDSRFTINGWIRRGAKVLNAGLQHTISDFSASPYGTTWISSLLGDL